MLERIPIQKQFKKTQKRMSLVIREPGLELDLKLAKYNKWKLLSFKEHF